MKNKVYFVIYVKEITVFMHI